MVVFDATTLLLLLSPTAAAPRDSRTGATIDGVQERVEFLVEQLEKARTRIVVPTPALSEILVRARDAGPSYMREIGVSARFKIVPFDQRAAVEVAHMTREAISAGDKKAGAQGTWAKVKYDRQIVAIAKVEGATTIYSDDQDVRTLATAEGLSVIGVGDLPLRPAAAQGSLILVQPEAQSNGQDEGGRQIAAAAAPEISREGA